MSETGSGVERRKQNEIEDEGVENADAEVKDDAKGLILLGPYKGMPRLEQEHAGKERKIYC